MGRKLIYKTNDEKVMAQRKWAREYYQRNREERRKIRMERYYGKKIYH